MTFSTVALVLLVSAIGASSSTAANANGVQWKPRPRVEYEFELTGRSLAGLPALQGQYSGVQYGGRVRVQGLTADTAVIRLEDMTWSALHARLQSGWWAASPDANQTLSGHAHLGRTPMPLSGSAAVARFHDGQVTTVLVSREARDWEVNLLQGVLGHLQVQQGGQHGDANSLHGQRRNPRQQSEQGVYRVLENGVSGRCMVQYEVSPAPTPAQMTAAESRMCAGKPYVQITKTKNFTDCEQYAEQSRGLPRCSPAGNSCSSLWARNTLTQLIGCGSGADMQLVQAVSSSSMQAELQTREDSRAVVHSSVNMTLARVQPVRQRLAAPKDGVVINGLGFRAAGKQVNGQWGLDSDYSNSSEEKYDADDSVEVIRHPQQQQQQHKQRHDSSEDSSSSSSDSSDSSDSTSDSNSSRAQKHKKHDSSDESASSNDSSNASRKHNQKHSQKQQQQQQRGSDSDSASDSSNESGSNASKHHQKHSQKHNQKHNQKQQQQQQRGSDSDSASDSSNESGSNASKHHQKHSQKHNLKHKQASSEQDDSSSEQKKGKHSRRPRSAKPSHAEDDDLIDDVFAGALSPAAVQKNATLRAALQQRLAQDVNKAGAELLRPDGPSSRTMERLSMAIRLARALSAEQLRSVHDQVHDQAGKELLRDILAMCGSTPCVQETVTMMKDGKLSSFAAQMALSNLADRVAVPTRTILKHLQDLYQTTKDQQVKIAAALAMGKLAGRAARPVAGLTAAFLAEQFAQQAGHSQDDKDAALLAPLAMALGTTATPQAAEALIKAVNNENLSPYQRAQCVLALRSAAQRAPARVRDALLSLFHAPSQPAAVRMAAVSVLVYLRPSLPLWQRLAVSTFYEPDLAVASYVWSTIYSFAQMQDPTFRQQTVFARLALPLARRVPQGTHLAFNMVMAGVDARLDRMVHDHASFAATAEATNVYYRRVSHRVGVATLDQEVDVWAANADDLIQAAVDAVVGRQDKAAARPAMDAKTTAFHSTRSIHDKLNIVRRRMQDPQGHVRLTLKPFVNNMLLPFNKDTPSHIAKAASQLMAQLHAETSFHGQQMGGEEMSMATVTEMGFPVNLRIQAPWLVRAQGSAQLHRNLTAQANITCLYTAGLSAQLSVQPSWNSREYVAAIQGHALVHMPATLVRAQVNATDGRVSVHLEPGHQDASTVLARVSSQPMTAALELSRAELASESATVHNASRSESLAGRGPEMVELSPWEAFSLNLRAPVEGKALVAWLRSSRTVLGFPVLGRPLTASRLELVASRPRGLTASFSMVKAMQQSGDLRVVYPASLRQDDTADASDAPAASTTTTTTTTTEAPVSTTTESDPTTSTTTETPVVRTARASGEHRAAGNGSMFMDNGDLDLSRSVFNATTLNPYDNKINGSSELYVLSQVLAGMSAGRGFVVGVNVSTEAVAEIPASSYSGFWTYGANLGNSLRRAGVFGRSDADNAQMAATAAILADVHAHVDLDTVLQQGPGYMIKAEYQQVDSQAVKRIATAAVESGRTEAKAQRAAQAAKEQHCVAEHGRNASAAIARVCREILADANTPDQFNVTVNYNNPADEAWGPALHGALQAARAYLWNQDNLAVDTLAAGNSNELGAGVTFRADGAADGWLQTPRTLTRMSGFGAPVAAKLSKGDNQKAADFCGVTTSRLVTLGRVQSDLKLDDCWHLLAKDCSGKSRVAVLAKAAGSAADDLVVEVNIDNYQVARLFPDGSATLNGAAVVSHDALVGAAVQVRDADDVQVMSIVRAQDGAAIVSLPDHGMNVVYGNTSVVIQADASLRGRLCGMCGNLGTAATGDLRNPTNKVEKTVQAFADSYAIKDAQCGKGRH